jgi:hypothetical protein
MKSLVGKQAKYRTKVIPAKTLMICKKMPLSAFSVC